MKESLKLNAKRALAAAKWPSMVFYRGKYLFVLSHMRSRSSLLSHILGSNQEICGYKEEYRPYPNNRSLFYLRLRLMLKAEEYKLSKKTRFFLDKIVHNKLEISPGILEGQRFHALLLIREPIGTYQSMVRLSKLRKIDEYGDIDFFADYYVGRLEKLAEYSEVLKRRGLYVDSDSLLEKTELTLQNISTNLDLEAPLSARYDRFADTGRPFAGDSSESIKRGTIFTPEYGKDNQAHCEVPDECHAAYKKFTGIIENNSTRINP